VIIIGFVLDWELEEKFVEMFLVIVEFE